LIKRILKIFGAILGTLLLAICLYGWIISKPLPEGKSGPEADALASKMLTALNVQAYKNTNVLEWDFRNGANTYRWDKKSGKVMVSWKDYSVNLNLSNPSKSKVYENNKALNTKDKEKLIKTAVDYFNNDSFWLVAPYKVYDKGVIRSIVDLEDGSQGLLVTHSKGGTTPGDSYLWILNPNGFPNSFKMWTKVIPIGGLEATWDDWIVIDNGAFLPKSHKFGPITLDMGQVNGYNQ
jgi:hypothetical protein